MKTKMQLDDPKVPFHISARSINREWFLNIDDVWEVFENYLYFLNKAYAVEILSFVLMTNHYHLLARFPKSNMSRAMQYFMRETSRSISKPAHRINQVYGSRYFRSEISSYHYYLHVYKYLYRNPVETGIVEKVEEYRYSTLAGLLGTQSLLIPVEEDLTLFSDLDGVLEWLNRKPLSSNHEQIKKALKRKKFVLGIDRKTRKPHELEFNAY